MDNKALDKCESLMLENRTIRLRNNIVHRPTRNTIEEILDCEEMPLLSPTPKEAIRLLNRTPVVPENPCPLIITFVPEVPLVGEKLVI